MDKKEYWIIKKFRQDSHNGEIHGSFVYESKPQAEKQMIKGDILIKLTPTAIL